MTDNNIDYYYDFGSPNAYFAHRVIPAFEARTGVKVTYVPILLGGVFKATGNQPPMMQNAGVPVKNDYMRMEIMRFQRIYGLSDFAFNPHFPINTITLMRGAVAAEALGVLDAYIELMFVHMWEKGSAMGDKAVWAEALTAGGLDADAFSAAVQDPSVKQRLMDSTDAAVKAGVFGAPTFRFRGELYFGKDQLDMIEKEL